MTVTYDDAPPAWVARFLAALPGSPSMRAAAREAGAPISTVCRHRDRNPQFRAQIEAGLAAAKAHQGEGWGGARRVGSPKLDRFLVALAETSNVAAAAEATGVKTSTVYRKRRGDPAFARRWYAALAEGYDNLEMELLGRLRSGEADGGGAAKTFDTATALRCLTAHRESVARERARRGLAEEVVTIASINAKIDAMRLRQQGNQRAIAKVRKAVKTGGKRNDG